MLLKLKLTMKDVSRKSTEKGFDKLINTSKLEYKFNDTIFTLMQLY